MEIIKIKTHDEYDRILKCLEDKGCELCSGEKPTTWNIWKYIKKGNHCIQVNGTRLEYSEMEYWKQQYPECRIQTVDEYIGTKFKVGDKVKVREDLEEGDRCGSQGVVGEMLAYNGEILTISNIVNPGEYDVKENCWTWSDEMLEKVEEVVEEAIDHSKVINEAYQQMTRDYHSQPMIAEMLYGMDSVPSTFNKLKDKTMEIVKFAKNLTLSSNEKLMRKKGLKDENGIYTDAYTEIVDNLVYSEYEAKVLEIAKKSDEEEKK